MAAFSYQNQHPPSLLDLSVFLPNSPIKMSGLLQEGYINTISSCYPYSSRSEHSHSSIPSEKQKTDSFPVVDLGGSSDQVTQMVTPLDMKRKHRDGSCLSSSESKDSKRPKTKKQRDCSGNSKEKEKKEIVPSGFVHVRARRGEATDSHSLAERVRRERISERLKLLQSLVPGCDKVTSKALMLDEIINYVQSLQHQVEFLSMRLASMNPILYDFDAVEVNSMVKQEKVSNLETPTPLPPLEQQVLVTPSSTAVAHATTSFNTVNNYSFPCLLQPEGQRQDDVSLVLWSADEQRQRFFNHSDFTTLCSFQ